MAEIEWADFERVNLQIGTIKKVDDFPEARKPAYKLWIDFGPELGIKKSSAQITYHYNKHDLIGMQVLAVTNFKSKQIGPFTSEVLVTGFADENGEVVLAIPHHPVPNGKKLY